MAAPPDLKSERPRGAPTAPPKSGPPGAPGAPGSPPLGDRGNGRPS